MKYSITAVMLLSGCSSLAPEDAVESQSQAATSFHTFINQSGSLPGNKFCHAVELRGTFAHDQGPFYDRCGFAYSAESYSSSGSAYATANHCANPLVSGSGTAVIMCEDWTNFTNGANKGESGFFYTHFWDDGFQSSASGSTTLWDVASICYLTAAFGLSHAWEGVQIDTIAGTNPLNWRLNAAGTRGIGATARCVYTGMPANVTRHTVTNWSGNGTFGYQTGMSTSVGVCLINGVMGNLDDGAVKLDRSTGFWQVDVTGQVQRANVDCFRYTYP